MLLYIFKYYKGRWKSFNFEIRLFTCINRYKWKVLTMLIKVFCAYFLVISSFKKQPNVTLQYSWTVLYLIKNKNLGNCICNNCSDMENIKKGKGGTKPMYFYSDHSWVSCPSSFWHFQMYMNISEFSAHPKPSSNLAMP